MVVENLPGLAAASVGQPNGAYHAMMWWHSGLGEEIYWTKITRFNERIYSYEITMSQNANYTAKESCSDYVAAQDENDDEKVHIT